MPRAMKRLSPKLSFARTGLVQNEVCNMKAFSKDHDSTPFKPSVSLPSYVQFFAFRPHRFVQITWRPGQAALAEGGALDVVTSKMAVWKSDPLFSDRFVGEQSGHFRWFPLVSVNELLDLLCCLFCVHALCRTFSKVSQLLSKALPFLLPSVPSCRTKMGVMTWR